MAATRGLCTACYQAARYAIRTGQITDEELVEDGLMRPRHMAATSPFRGRLAELLDRPKRRRKPRDASNDEAKVHDA